MPRDGGSVLTPNPDKSEPKPKTQLTQPRGIDPETGQPYEPIEIPVPKREDVEDALTRVIRAEPDEDDGYDR